MQDKEVQDILKQQVNDIMNEPQSAARAGKRRGQGKKKRKALKVTGFLVFIILVIIAVIVGTKGGRSIVYKAASSYIYGNMNNEDVIKEYHEQGGSSRSADSVRHEDYVTNFLIFGIEEIKGARNTDSMMIASINTKDKSIKLTSLLRDSYVEIPDHKANKLNSAYAKGGAKLLIDTIEYNYKIRIDGYASVNFESFEKIVDILGGVTIELGEEEAKYLNRTNYISKKENRKVKPGVNKLNGNQVMGYCRVRRVKTLGGANYDYGRIIRQQRTLKAIFDSFKSKNIFELLKVSKECLGYITTNLTEIQIKRVIEAVVENKIKTLDTFRIPVNGAFDDPKKYNGISDPLVLDWNTNRIELFKFIYNDTEEAAKKALAALK